MPRHRGPDAVGATADVTVTFIGGAGAGARASPAADVVVVTDAVDLAAGVSTAGGDAVFVTLAALARSVGAPVPAGVIDEARELATHGDVCDAWDEPEPSDPALRVVGGNGGGDGGVEGASGGDDTASDTSYGSLVPETGGGPDRVHTSTPDTATFLRLALEVWSGDGSLVLTRGEPLPDVLASRLAAEGVTRQG